MSTCMYVRECHQTVSSLQIPNERRFDTHTGNQRIKVQDNPPRYG